ncbi:hypothetical protein [Archaeoglobus profundus]|uniref:hypothetical protein n=1 Tax=Archaeoglobus profundus TaxID=84156 RepID=UPI000A789071|nr:hypothetical protein [Archaeoglobus profundus]
MGEYEVTTKISFRRVPCRLEVRDDHIFIETPDGDEHYIPLASITTLSIVKEDGTVNLVLALIFISLSLAISLVLTSFNTLLVPIVGICLALIGFTFLMFWKSTYGSYKLHFGGTNISVESRLPSLLRKIKDDVLAKKAAMVYEALRILDTVEELDEGGKCTLQNEITRREEGHEVSLPSPSRSNYGQGSLNFRYLILNAPSYQFHIPFQKISYYSPPHFPLNHCPINNSRVFKSLYR